ncbi:MAG: hypothetical protein HY016_09730 [Nitrosomonadales bacterium]|nr:hypothetical protein [Nitrosomonadales bacterium]
MTKLILFVSLFLTGNSAWSDALYHGLQVEINRTGSLYSFAGSLDTTLDPCAAYRYLTDYEADKKFPGVVESIAYRLSASKVRVDRAVDEQVLFFDYRLHQILEFTERPFDRVEFTQLAGDLKSFRGSWDIVPMQQGSTLRFKGFLEPDTILPLFIIDHFIKNGLIAKLNAVIEMAEKRKDMPVSSCVD